MWWAGTQKRLGWPASTSRASLGAFTLSWASSPASGHGNQLVWLGRIYFWHGNWDAAHRCAAERFGANERQFLHPADHHWHHHCGGRLRFLRKVAPPESLMSSETEPQAGALVTPTPSEDGSSSRRRRRRTEILKPMPH